MWDAPEPGGDPGGDVLTMVCVTTGQKSPIVAVLLAAAVPFAVKAVQHPFRGPVDVPEIYFLSNSASFLFHLAGVISTRIFGPVAVTVCIVVQFASESFLRRQCRGCLSCLFSHSLGGV